MGFLIFRYSVNLKGAPFRVVRDFSQEPLFACAPELFEQTATVWIDVRNNETKATAHDELSFRIVPRGGARHTGTVSRDQVSLRRQHEFDGLVGRVDRSIQDVQLLETLMYVSATRQNRFGRRISQRIR